MDNTLLGRSTSDLKELFAANGFPSYRGAQVAQWLYVHSAHTFAAMSSLPAPLREQLASTYTVGRSQQLSVSTSADGSFKLLLGLSDGHAVETVGLPYPDRLSCCVSTQVGCPIGCVFCATGLSGYIRNLSAGEIVDQVLSVQEWLPQAASTSGHAHQRVDHVTFMGMGEPLLNYEATITAARLLNEEMGIAMRRLTISTVGLIPGIYRLAQERLQLTLAVSLHAPSDELRRRLIPGMSRYDVKDIILACDAYVRQTGRRVTFEYCMLGGINDSVADATALARLLHGLNCHVNLIPFNPVPGLPFRASVQEAVRSFREALSAHGIPVTQRLQRGSDAAAACGQLRRRLSATTTRPAG